MGHALLPALPISKRWKEVIALAHHGAGVAQLASATLRACEDELKGAANDHGVGEAVWLLMQLPIAARGDDFVAELCRIGVEVPPDAGLADLVAGVSEAIDRRLRNNRGRTDLGELAQAATAETLYGHVGGRLRSMFDTGTDELQQELARLKTAKQFGLFARDYFSRFITKVIGYFLDRALPGDTGEDGRFRTFRQQRAFTEALDDHCRETAGILEKYAGEWLMKHQWESKGDVDRGMAARFTGYAMTKLVNELRRRDQTDGR